jgi:hypothetical protein
MAVFGSFLATALITSGFLLVLYSVLPVNAWFGIMASSFGCLILLEIYRGRLEEGGLRIYLPDVVNDYLTRTDIVDQFVRKLRENRALPKMFRIMLIKWFDLRRDEIVEVLTGVWPRFRDLSEDRTLLQFTPAWFRRIYSPSAKMGDKDGFEDADEFTLEPLQIPTPRFSDGPSSRGDYNLLPLVLWLAENRVRWAMTEGLPVARRIAVRTLVPALLVVIMWRRIPGSRKPLTGLFGLVLAAYVISITRGLPSSSERILKLLKLSLYRRRGERPYKTNQSNGSMAALLYAFIEPFEPVVNIADPREKVSHVSRSPALSQASTLDQTIDFSAH